MKKNEKRIQDTTNAVFAGIEGFAENAIALEIKWNGYRFDTYFWKVNTGWFVCISNWEACCLISNPTDVMYNANKIASVIRNDYMAEAIAWALCNYWKGDVVKK